MLEAAILYLLTNARPGGLTGALVLDRVYPGDFPTKPLFPAVLYQQISGPMDYNMDGGVPLTPCRFQFDVVAKTASGAQNLRNALIRDLSGFRGVVPTSPAITIQGIFVEDMSDSGDPALEEQAASQVKRKIVDATFWLEG